MRGSRLGPTDHCRIATITKTVQVKVRITKTVAPSPSAAPAAVNTPVAAPQSDFDRVYAVQKVGDIIEDLTTVDHRLNDGIGVSSALSLLSDSYGRLAEAGTPPGVAADDYQARLSTLESFASTAADEYDVNPTEGHARYAVVRKQTGPLFQRLNAVLGTHFSLP